MSKLDNILNDSSVVAFTELGAVDINKSHDNRKQQIKDLMLEIMLSVNGNNTDALRENFKQAVNEL